MRQLVIGCGEVGTAVAALLGADSCDLDKPSPYDSYDVLHICFPYSEKFCEAVAAYRERFKPSLVIIHSTVPVGTSRKCDAVHSPIRGKHPHLLESLRVFVKYFGGERAEEAAALFPQCKVHCTPKQETTEALKLWDTTIYGVNIALEKTIYEACQQLGIDFDVVYRHAGETYNAGYAAMGNPEFCKYVLKHVDGPLGGHCLIENAVLLHEQEPSEIVRILLELGKSVDSIKGKPHLNRAWLYAEYWGKERSSEDIASEIGCSGSNILQVMCRMGIKRRTLRWSESDIETLKKLSGELTFKEIAEHVGKTHDAVRSMAIKLGIESIYDPALPSDETTVAGYNRTSDSEGVQCAS